MLAQTAANPYTTGPLVQPSDFFGRDELLNDLVSYLRRGVSVGLMAPPRMGGSWLLRRLQFEDIRFRLLGDAHNIIALDCIDPQTGQPLATPVDFYRQLAAQLQADYPGALPALADHEIEIAIQVLDFISRLDGLWVLTLDNFVALERFPVSFFDRLRARILHGHLVLVVASQVDLNDLKLPTHPDGSTFAQVLHPIILTPWTPRECRRFFQATSERSGVDMLPYERSIVSAAGRAPGLVQAVASLVFDALRAGAAPLEDVYDQAARDLAPHFGRQLQAARLSPSDKAALRAIALDAYHARGPQTSVDKLRRYGLVNEDIQVSSALLKDYLKNDWLRQA